MGSSRTYFQFQIPGEFLTLPADGKQLTVTRLVRLTTSVLQLFTRDGQQESSPDIRTMRLKFLHTFLIPAQQKFSAPWPAPQDPLSVLRLCKPAEFILCSSSVQTKFTNRSCMKEKFMDIFPWEKRTNKQQ